MARPNPTALVNSGEAAEQQRPEADDDAPRLQLPPGMWTGALLQFQVCWQFFEGRVPSDLADLVARRQKMAPQFIQCPPLLLVMAALKFGPVRDIFQNALDAHKDPSGEWNWRRLFRVLVATVRTLDAKAVSLQAWTANCHARGTGYLTFFKTIGLLLQAGHGHKASDGILVTLGSLNLRYILVTKPTADLQTTLVGILATTEILRAVQLRPLGARFRERG